MSSSARLKLSSGRQIPQLALGVYAIANEETAEAVETAFNVGYRHVDTAEIYGNEEGSVRGIKNFLDKNPHIKRSDVYYTTKIWISSSETYQSALTTIEESARVAKDLGYIDLYLVHHPSGSSKARLDTYRALQDAVERGLVKDIGVSNYGTNHLHELLNWSGLKYKPVVNQIELNPWLQRDKIVDECRKLDIVVESFSPLMLGRRFHEPQLIQLAHKHHCTPAQVLIKWNLQKGFVALPKSSNPKRIKENFELDHFNLTAQELENLGDKNESFLASGGTDTLQ